MTAILMNASVAALPRNGLLLDLPRRLGVPANDDALRALGAINGPETALIVQFIGIDASQQQIAVASFPSARRFTVLQP